MNFFEQFDSEWGSRLGVRTGSFRAMFDYLAKTRPRGHLIVETGCTDGPTTGKETDTVRFSSTVLRTPMRARC